MLNTYTFMNGKAISTVCKRESHVSCIPQPQESTLTFGVKQKLLGFCFLPRAGSDYFPLGFLLALEAEENSDWRQVWKHKTCRAFASGFSLSLCPPPSSPPAQGVFSRKRHHHSCLKDLVPAVPTTWRLFAAATTSLNHLSAGITLGVLVL